MRRKRYTVVIMCMCGSCDDQSGVYWVFQPTRNAAEDAALGRTGKMADPQVVTVFPGWIDPALD